MKNFLTVIVNVEGKLKDTKKFIKYFEKFTDIPYEMFFFCENTSEKHFDFIQEYEDKNKRISAVRIQNDKARVLSDILADAEGNIIVICKNNIILTKKYYKALVWYFNKVANVGIVNAYSDEDLSTAFIDNEIDIEDALEIANNKRKSSKHEYVEVKEISHQFMAFNEVILTNRDLQNEIENETLNEAKIIEKSEQLGYKTIEAQDVIFFLNSEISAEIENNDSENENTTVIENSNNNELNPISEIKSYKGLVQSTYSIQDNYDNAKRNLQIRDFEKALAYLEYVIDDFGSLTNKNSFDLEDIYDLAGNVAIMLKESATALSYFEKELQIDENSSRACTGIADCFVNLNELVKAKIMYQWAVKCDELNNTAKAKLGKLNEILGLEENDITEL